VANARIHSFYYMILKDNRVDD